MKSKVSVVGTTIAILFLFGCAPRSHSNKNSAPPNSSQNKTSQSAQSSGHSNTSASGVSNQGGLLVPFTGAAIGAQARLGQIPNDVPPATAINTKGGRLLVGYLRGTFSGETVVDQVFDTQSQVPYRLGEISAAILKLRNAGQFTGQDEDKVQILQTSLNKRLIQTIQDHERYGNYFKYGTSAAVALVAGFYAPEIVDAGSGALDSSIVQTPKNAIVNGFKRGYNAASGWTSSLFRRGSKAAADAAGEAAAGTAGATEAAAARAAAEAAAAGAAGPQRVADAAANEAMDQASRTATFDDLAGTVGEGADVQAGATTARQVVTGEVVSPSGEATPVVKPVKPSVYSRVMGAYKTRFGRLAPEQVAVVDMARALPPELARGFELIEVPDAQLDTVTALKYSRTGIPGFAMHQAEGSDYLTVRTLTSSGPKYFYVRGRGVETVTEGGHKMITSGSTVIGVASTRMRGWASDSAGFFRRNTGRVKDWTLNSRASQWLTSQAGKRWIQSTAVGGASGLVTFWLLDPINTQYLTVNDYLLALSKQGINLNDFPDDLRTELQSEAKVPTKLAQPLD